MVYYNLPDEYDDNFIKLDISKIDKVVDGVFVRWDEHGNVYVSNPDAKLVASQLTSNQYSYAKALPLNGKGMPNVLIFHRNGYEVNVFTESIFPKR